MKRSESIVKLAAALVAVQAEFRAITKDAKNPHFGNSYASLDTITETVRPLLAKNGLAIVQGTTAPHTDEIGHLKNLNIETTLIHTSGEWIESIVTLPVGTVPIKVDKKVVGAEPTAQTAGGTITYGRRYGLAALLALTTEEDDDGNTASTKAAAAPRADNKSPAEKVMPFGKTKGTKLGDMKDSDLESALKWCREKDAEKFASLITALEEVLEDRRLAAAGDEEYPDDY